MATSVEVVVMFCPVRVVRMVEECVFITGGVSSGVSKGVCVSIFIFVHLLVRAVWVDHVELDGS